MPIIDLFIQNNRPTRNLRPDRTSTLFARAYAQLAVNKLNPGKVAPIFSYINGDYKSFGALTLNSGGSVSFFPDFYHLDNFDHLTLNKDFINGKGHFTLTSGDGEHTKTIGFQTSPLAGSNYYHLVTFGMDTDDLLMDLLPEIKLPGISYNTENERVKYMQWIQESVDRKYTLDFPDHIGSYFVQILVLPKGRPTERLAVERTYVEKLINNAQSFEGETFDCRLTELQTPAASDFTIYILSFRVNNSVAGSFGFLLAQDPTKPLPPEMVSASNL